MSTANKTRYEVQKIIIDCLADGLAACIGQNHGFGIMEFAQASFQKADKIILVNPIRAKRIGWQGVKYNVVNSALKRNDEWIEEQSWQIHTLLKKSQTPAITDLQADDVASMLITWLNGAGVYKFRTSGCAPLRISNENIVIYNDDSELYQKRAVFTMKLHVPKELSITQDDMTCDEYTFAGTYPV